MPHAIYFPLTRCLESSGKQSRQLHAHMQASAARAGAVYASLFQSVKTIPLHASPA